MPKLKCLCGTSINLSQIPCPHGFKLFHEASLEATIENLVQAHDASESQADFSKKAFRSLHAETKGTAQIYECPNCFRLAVFRRASDQVPALWYQLEKQDPSSEGNTPTPLRSL